MQDDLKTKKQILLTALAKTFKTLRLKTKKSISLASDELNISKSIWSDVELGKNDLQFSTFLRMIEALDITPSAFFKELNSNLPKNFSFLE